MNKTTRKTPKFKSISEEALFWDTHDITDYLKAEKPLSMAYAPKVEKKETISLRMAPSLKRRVGKIAKGYDISPSSLVRMWVVEKVGSHGECR